MAERKVEIRPKADDGTYPDIIYPKTTADMVVVEDTGRTVAEHLVDDEKRVPSGIIVMWSGTHNNIPKGWNLCDGTNGTPDLRDRFIVGSGNKYSIGDTGGSDSVTLTTSQLPRHSHGSGTLGTGSAGSHSHGSGTLKTSTSGSHSHTGSTNTSGSHSHTISLYGTGTWTANVSGRGDNDSPISKSTSTSGSHSHSLSINSAGSHSHTISGSTSSGGSHSHSISGSTSSTGSGQAHENRPPYYALAYIMKL